MSSLFSDPPDPPKTSPPDKHVDETEENARLSERMRRLRSKGRQSTLLTRGQDLGPAPTNKKTLLGE